MLFWKRRKFATVRLGAKGQKWREIKRNEIQILLGGDNSMTSCNSWSKNRCSSKLFQNLISSLLFIRVHWTCMSGVDTCIRSHGISTVLSGSQERGLRISGTCLDITQNNLQASKSYNQSHQDCDRHCSITVVHNSVT